MHSKKNILLVICVLGALLTITTLIYNEFNNQEVITKGIDKDKIKNEVLEKIDIMSADEMLVNLYTKSVNTDNIDHQLVLNGILLTLDEDGSISDSEADELYERTNICTTTSYINLSSVEDKINKIYGKKFNINYKTILQNSDYIYDDKNKRFYELCISSFDKSNFIDTYIYDMDIQTEEANVYIAVSYGKEEIVEENGKITDKTNIKIYTDYEQTNLYKEYIYSIEDDFMLDETNYKDFSLYKFVFKRVDNEYYFDSLEKVNK